MANLDKTPNNDITLDPEVEDIEDSEIEIG
jgi:hypothetical protein